MSRIVELIQQICPDGVNWKQIGGVAEVNTGSSNGNEAEVDGLYPFFVRSQFVKRKNTYEFDDEAIIIPGEGGIGEIFHYVKGKYALHQRVYRISFYTEFIETRFAYYYFTAYFKKYILLKAVNSTVKSIRKPMIESFSIPVPPLLIQQEIVRILDNFSSLQTELQAELQARKSQYEFYRNQLLNFSHSDNSTGESNIKVKWMKLGDIASFIYGFTDKAKDYGDCRFIRITDIGENGCLMPISAKYIDLNDENKRFLVKKGDLLMARTGATYGKTLYVPNNEKSIYASFLIKIDLDNNILNNRFYWHFSKSNLYWNQAKALVSTAGQPQFNSNALCRVLVPIPSLSEQARIVSILDRFDKLCNDLNEGLPAEIEARQKQYEYYRDKLLTFKEKV